MVYNAMKLFMEINPQLFDECSQDYNELQSSATARERARLTKWEKLQAQAEKMKKGQAAPSTNGKVNTNKPESDATQDSQQRLDALKLHDETNIQVKQQSVSPVLSFVYSSLPLLRRPFTILQALSIAKQTSFFTVRSAHLLIFVLGCCRGDVEVLQAARKDLAL